jgi:hypothetical protein
MRTSPLLVLVPEQREQNDDRDWYADQPKQNSPSHESLLVIGL